MLAQAILAQAILAQAAGSHASRLLIVGPVPPVRTRLVLLPLAKYINHHAALSCVPCSARLMLTYARSLH
eukprot:5698862-Karenia_brevis.AAC.1